MGDVTRVGVSDSGRRVGEYHPKANLTDEQVEHMRELYEEGAVGYKTLAKFFGCSWQTVRAIVQYTRRNVPSIRWRTIKQTTTRDRGRLR